MYKKFYLKRTLDCEGQSYTEAELLARSNYIVILAEPGAGKTELLKSLAKQLGTKEVTANGFSYSGARQCGIPLVIDAFDELAKLDKTGIYRLLSSISKASATHVIISSRSSEWHNSATSTFEEILGHSPMIARLRSFDDSEQREIYNQYTETANFAEFRAEITRFSLDPLLPNPQFLKLFADAYIESNGHFTDKRSIFTKAIAHLVKEANVKARPNPNLTDEKKINLSSDIFSKLLLSGAEGISISEANNNRMYPLVGSISSSIDVDASSILATRLFKPGDDPDFHRPVHKMVAEYCAANHLTKRIVNPSDTLTLLQCLTVIAPNSTVRDELRGLLGWMAALGNMPIQETLIRLDPYAVLANGDPSQLEPSSKWLLLSRLKEIEVIDPYFRRGDSWRSFSVAGFFTQEVVEHIRPIILNGSDGHLRDLLLELLDGSQASKWITLELRQLVLAHSESTETRMLAMKCLLGIEFYDPSSDLSELILEASSSSLNIAESIIESFGPDTFEPNELKIFFLSCVGLYAHHKNNLKRVSISDRHFVRRLVHLLDLDVIASLLDSLSQDLACTCGKKAYECECRTGISKIIGLLLDRYFQLEKPPFEPVRVWCWIRNLNFSSIKSVKDATAVKVIQENNALRQGIITHVFGNLKDRDQIFEAKFNKFGFPKVHSGLSLNYADREFIVDLAFENDNLELWVSFMAYHQLYFDLDKLGPDSLRHHMRVQAAQKPEFMRRWASQNRQASIEAKQNDQNFGARNRRSIKRRDKKRSQINSENIKFVQENREALENGTHWNCLARFSELVLNKPESIEQEFGDENLVRSSLRNCLGFIEPDIPDLQKLAELQCSSRYLLVETILIAACFEIMRVSGNLNDIKPSLLIALRTNLNVGYSAFDESERDALKVEVDRIIFPDCESAEQFLRSYLEPQLADPECSHPQVDLLDNDAVFRPLRAVLSIEWLSRFDELGFYALDTVFEIASQYADREELNRIILVRCSQLLSNSPEPINDDKLEKRRKFWFCRAFYFVSPEEAEPYLNWLALDKNSIFLFSERSSRMCLRDSPYWPKLSSHKIEVILDAFFKKWPKVHLPNSYGTGSPRGENAYRFLIGIIWSIGSDSTVEAIPVLDRLIVDPRYADIHSALKSILAEQYRIGALNDYVPPTPEEIVTLLDHNSVVTVEGLRQLVLQELTNYQKEIKSGEFNSANRFYTKDKIGNDKRLGEVKSVEIIAERLHIVLLSQNITIHTEHQIKNQNRIDITAAKMINGKRRLLVIEAKGQWHKELYSAASSQLYERYSSHPDAEQQGIYLIIWFGSDELVGGHKVHGIHGAQELKRVIEENLEPDLKGLIDIFVLDVSRT